LHWRVDQLNLVIIVLERGVATGEINDGRADERNDTAHLAVVVVVIVQQQRRRAALESG
jgi:hypothetical protein